MQGNETSSSDGVKHPLPRPCDRSLVSSTLTIDQGILEKTLEFAPGQWLLSSYVATGMENVPIFIAADNSETEVEKYLKLERLKLTASEISR